MTDTTETPTLNVPLFETAINMAIDSYNRVQAGQNRYDPITRIGWNQGDWVRPADADYEDDAEWCGTACCIAGSVAALDAMERGFVPSYPNIRDFVRDRQDGMTQDYSAYGQERLGLTADEAYRLFQGSNSIERVVSLAKNIAAARGVTLNLHSVVG